MKDMELMIVVNNAVDNYMNAVYVGRDSDDGDGDEEWPESEPMCWVAGNFMALTKTLRLCFGADVQVVLDGNGKHHFHIVDVRGE